MSSSVTPSRPRRTVQLRPNLDMRLVAYTACATGVGLVMSPASEAKIVFTPANTTITGSVPLDVNGDGISDFFFHNSGNRAATGTMRYSQFVDVSGAQASNQVIGYLKNGRFASALSARFSVGSKDHFISYFPAGLANCAVESFGTVTRGGQWFGVKNKFLGFKFLVNGQTHYGWARLSFRNSGSCNMSAILTGYAYETVANKPILTGQRMGPDEGGDIKPVSAVTSASLGMLAQGSVALALWRRQEKPIPAA